MRDKNCGAHQEVTKEICPTWLCGEEWQLHMIFGNQKTMNTIAWFIRFEALLERMSWAPPHLFPNRRHPFAVPAPRSVEVDKPGPLFHQPVMGGEEAAIKACGRARS